MTWSKPMKSTCKRPVGAHFLSVALCAALSCLWAETAVAGVPASIALEGSLLTAAGGPVSDGPYTLTFALYASKQAKTPLWTETVSGIPVKGGAFVHALGSAKALTPQLLDGASAAWLGVQVAKEPELPRGEIHAVPYARRAQVAASGSFPYAASKTVGGAASDLACTGCVSLSELKFDGDIDLDGYALKAKKVIATEIKASSVMAGEFIGDGSQLTGINIPAGSCQAGKVVTGIDKNGKLVCGSAASSLPKDGLDEVSNGLLTSEFVNVFKGTPGIGIPDNNPIGMNDTIVVPDVGVAKSLLIHVDVTNSNLKDVTVTLYDPNKGQYLLFGGGSGQKLKTSYPKPAKPATGDLSTWAGKNPKGKWMLRVVDTAFKNNKLDGQVVAWSVQVETLSNKQVESKGAFLATGGLKLPSAAQAPFKCDATRRGWIYYDTKTDGVWVCRKPGWTEALFRQCGNGILEAGEHCDDGNLKDGDKCPADCLFKCGDGICSPSVGETIDNCKKDCPLAAKWIESNWTTWYPVKYPHSQYKESLAIQTCLKYNLRLWRDEGGNKNDAQYAYDYNGNHNLGGHDICYKVQSACSGQQQSHTGQWQVFGKAWSDAIKAITGSGDGVQVVILNKQGHGGSAENDSSYCKVTASKNTVGWNGAGSGSISGMKFAVVLCAKHK